MFIYKAPQKTSFKANEGGFYANNNPSLINNISNLFYTALNDGFYKYGKKSKMYLKTLLDLNKEGKKTVTQLAENNKTNISLMNDFLVVLMNDGLISFELSFEKKKFNNRIKHFSVKKYSLTNKGYKVLSEFINEGLKV